MPALMWAADAVVVEPMELVPAPELPEEPMVARSYAGQSGTIAFTFELACPESVEIHGLVWDALSGPQADDPDSFYVSVDGEPDQEWRYGCGSTKVPDGTWLWQRMTGSPRTECDVPVLVFDLEAGPHELVVRNRESGGGSLYAAIAAVVVTADPAFDPAMLYDPAG
jgi:hypothetical protein